MKTTLIGIILFFTFNAGFSQSKEVVITPKKELFEYDILDNGTFFMQFASYSSIMETAYKKQMLTYSADLNKETDLDLSDVKLFSEGIYTPQGKVIGFEKKPTGAINPESSYFIGEKEFKIIKNKDSRGLIKEEINRIYSDKYQVVFGKQKTRENKNIVAGIEYNDLYFNRTNIVSGESKLINIVFPKESFPNSKMFYQYISNDNSKIYFVLNELSEDRKKNVCNLVSFDFEGKLIDRIPFIMELDNKNSFSLSNLTKYTCAYHQVVDGVNSNGSGRTIMREIPTEGCAVTLKIAPDGKSFYCYGKYNVQNAKLKIKGDRPIVDAGYYICKYDFTGKLLWKTEKGTIQDRRAEINTSVLAKRVFSGFYNLILLKDDKIGFWTRDKTLTDVPSQFFLLNNNDGTILKNEKKDFTYASEMHFSKKAELGLYNSYLYLGDKSEKVRLDMNTIFAMTFFPEVEKYINSKTNVRYYTKINPNGIFMIEEGKKETEYKLLKFEI